MSTKVNAPKSILGVVMVALLVIGSWATTTVRLSTATTNAVKATTATSPRSTSPQLSGNVFEIEGNAIDEAAAGEDWDTVVGDGTGTIPRPASAAIAATFVNDTNPATDCIFTGGGSKDDIDISSWKHKLGSVPDKDEIDDAGAALYTDPVSGHLNLFFFADRHANNGDAQIGFWFFLNSVSLAAPCTNSAGTFNGVHSVGDLLVLINFTQGGASTNNQVFKWVGPNNGGDTGSGNVLKTLTSAFATSAVNGCLGRGCTNPVLSPWPFTSKTPEPCSPPPGAGQGCFPTGSFFEGGVDLTAEGFGDVCFSSFLAETRSSQSIGATLKDFALGQFTPCGLEVTKTASPTEACVGTPVTYTYVVHNTGSSPLNVNLVDDNGTPGNTGDDIDVDGGSGITLAPNDHSAGGPDEATFTRSGIVLPVGTTTNRATATGTSGATTVTATTDASVTINPNPSCSVNPSSAFVCFGGSQQFCAEATGGTPGYTYLWSSGETSQCINKSAAGTYTVTVTDSKGCQTTCSGTLTVNPALSCTVSPPSAAICAGGSQEFCANATGGTPGYTYLWSSGETSQCITKSAAGTYTCTVTDSTGVCQTTCSGTLTINSPPTVTISTTSACATSISLTANGSGGSGSGYTFHWTRPDGSTFDGNPLTNVTATGNYSVTVTDSSGCSGSTCSIVGLCLDGSCAGSRPLTAQPKAKRRTR